MRPQRLITAKNGDFILYEPDEDNYTGYDKHGNPLSHSRTHELIKKAKPSSRIVKARHGFHGMVNQPTHFLAGEAGPERVNITPIHKKQNHIHHGFNLDLGEPKGFYYGNKEKKRTGFGEIDYDFGLKL